MSSFPAILRSLRKQHHHTQSELAQKLNVRTTTISNYETGFSIPDMDKMLKISEIYRVSVSELMGQTFVGAKEAKENINKLIEVVEDLTDIGSLSRESGESCIFVSANILDPGDYAGYRIEDGSLNKSGLKIGDIAVIRLQSSASNGDIAAVCIHDSEYMLRKYYDSGEQYITLSPDSSDDIFKPVVIHKSHDKVKILGVVSYSMIKM